MPVTTRTFRIFVSSTFEDLKEERDALQREVFPRLRALCEQHGARFQAVDLRWGVRDEAALDQKTMEICLREIERCQETAIKPNFIVLLGERYGWRPLPSRIAESEFAVLLRQVKTTAEQQLLERWYRRDDNAVPPEYRLQARAGEMAEPVAWAPVEERLRELLGGAVRQAGLPPAAAVKYQASATHQEILAGLGRNGEQSRHVFAFVRQSPGASDARLADLRRELETRLPAGNVVGFAPGEMAVLCEGVYRRLRGVIEEEARRFAERPELELEHEAHVLFGASRARVFCGRRQALEAVAAYLDGDERQALIVHGTSGSGKSALMALAAARRSGRVIRRFIGVTPESSRGQTLLEGLCRELGEENPPAEYRAIEEEFRRRLAAAGRVALFLDALDQFDAGDPARKLGWLPPALPAGVKVVLSTTAEGELLPPGRRVELGPMSEPEGQEALEQLLAGYGRRLQAWQRETVMAYFRRCGLPLYLKLAAEECRLWTSYASEAECRLGEGVAGIIDTLLERLSSRANHGPALVKRSLGYLAAARYGLTEDEMLGVLAADEQVWKDFETSRHHAVADRRLPVVIWSRLQLELEPYLTERPAPGGIVIAFYHNRLAERVGERYLGEEERRPAHAALAAYFEAQSIWLDAGRCRPNARKACELLEQLLRAELLAKASQAVLRFELLDATCRSGLFLDLLNQAGRLSRRLGPDGPVAVLFDALRLAGHVLWREPDELAAQLTGRLDASSMPEIALLVEEAAGKQGIWLRPQRGCLRPTGGPLVGMLEGHKYPVGDVAVCDDGSRVVSSAGEPAGSTVEIRTWSLAGGRMLRQLTVEVNSVGVWMSGDGERILYRERCDQLLGFGQDRGAELEYLGRHDGTGSVAFTAGGRLALISYQDGTVLLWDPERRRRVATVRIPDGPVHAAAMEGGSGQVYIHHDRNRVSRWDPETGEVRPVAPEATLGLGRFLHASGEESRIAHWDLGTGSWRELRTITKSWSCSEVTIPENPAYLLLRTSGGVEVRPVEGDGPALVLPVPDPETAALSMAAECPVVFFAQQDSVVRWDLDKGRASGLWESHQSEIAGLSASADGARVLSWAGDGTAVVWDCESRKEMLSLESHPDEEHFVLSPDGRRVAAGRRGSFTVWDVETGRSLVVGWKRGLRFGGLRVCRRRPRARHSPLQWDGARVGPRGGTGTGHADGADGQSAFAGLQPRWRVPGRGSRRGGTGRTGIL